MMTIGRRYLTGVTILEKLPVTPVALIEVDRVTRKQFSHQCGRWNAAGSE